MRSATSTVVMKISVEIRITNCGKESEHNLDHAGVDVRFECLSSPLVRPS